MAAGAALSPYSVSLAPRQRLAENGRSVYPSSLLPPVPNRELRTSLLNVIWFFQEIEQTCSQRKPLLPCSSLLSVPRETGRESRRKPSFLGTLMQQELGQEAVSSCSSFSFLPLLPCSRGALTSDPQEQIYDCKKTPEGGNETKFTAEKRGTTLTPSAT